MNLPLLLAAAYLGQLWTKAGLALAVRRREPVPAPADLRRVTVLQPVTSGDEGLESILDEDVREWPEAAIIWVIDRADSEAHRVVKGLQGKHPARGLRVLATAEPPAGCNPKLWKLAAALPLVTSEVVAVVDDDTRVPRRSLDRLVGALGSGADLATGLPSYRPARGYLSLLVAEFVNSSAILTYLSAAACTAPRSINGMCYALRTSLAREKDVFAACLKAVTDDLAVACAIRQCGGRIVQTAQPQHISTTVTGLTHYVRLMHRWFVCTRLLVQNETRFARGILLLAYGLHPLVLAALVVAAFAAPVSGLGPLLAVVGLRAVTLALLNRLFTGSWRHAPLASLLAELVQPLFLAGACLRPVVWWRRRRIRVQAFDRFEYLAP